MFLNKLNCAIILFSAMLFLCNILQGQVNSANNGIQITLKEKKIYDFVQLFFTHNINKIPFEKKWSAVFGEKTEQFFLQKIPTELSVFKDDISFAGEFIRFQFDNFLNRPKEKYSLDMYILPHKSANCKFAEKKYDIINIPLENQITECFARLNIISFDDKNKGIIPLNFYIGAIFLNSDVICLEYCDFLTNEKMALNGKIPALQNISQEIIIEYVKWLLLQKGNYNNYLKKLQA